MRPVGSEELKAQRGMNSAPLPRLLAVVQVAREQRVQCRQPGCGHSVWKAIHVVNEEGTLLVLGSTCFDRRYGSSMHLGTPTYGGSNGRKLTPEERQLLVENTAALIVRFEEEHAAAEALARLKLPAAPPPVRERVAYPPIYPSSSLVPNIGAPRAGAGQSRTLRTPPWPWMKAGTSLGYFKLQDGSAWVRVQRHDGQQMLAPWPAIDGWDEALPAHIGRANTELGAYVLADVKMTVAYLRKVGAWDRVYASWRELPVNAVGGPG